MAPPIKDLYLLLEFQTIIQADISWDMTENVENHHKTIYTH